MHRLRILGLGSGLADLSAMVQIRCFETHVEGAGWYSNVAMMNVFRIVLATVTLVAGHGFVQNATIGGEEYDVCDSTTLSQDL
jgi:hypothetical protein